MTDNVSDFSPFEKPVRIEDITARPGNYRFSFPEGALEDVAVRLEAEAVKSLQASLDVSRTGPIITVSGNVQADLVRICVSSLEPMTEQIDDAFEFELEHVDEMPDLSGEVEIDIEAPDPVTGDTLDLADLAIQQVSLAMEPFPRKAGATPVQDESEQPSLSPFAALKSLKQD